MKKRCLRCNELADINAIFCQRCGSNEFSAPIQQNYEGFSQQSQSMEVNNIPPVLQAPMKKKSLAPWQIALLVLVSVAVAILIYFFVADVIGDDDNSSVSVSEKDDDKVEAKTDEAKKDNQSDKKDNQADDNDRDSDSTVPFNGFDIGYTKGEIIDDVYINEWANIAVPISDTWPQADEVFYTTFENSTTDCGFASANTLTGSTAAILFEDLSGQSAVKDAEDYIDALINVTNTLYGSAVESYGDASSVTIANEKYLTLGFKHTNTGVILRYHVRIVDDYAVVIFASGLTEATIDSFIKIVSTANTI